LTHRTFPITPVSSAGRTRVRNSHIHAQEEIKMEKAYRNISYLFAGLLLFVILGFYQTYFGLFPCFQGVPDIAHLHAFGFLLWCGLLIVQPLLIRYNQLPLHRLLGRFTYFLVPYNVLTAFGMVEHAYHRDGVRWLLATNPPAFFLTVFELVWFVLFYSLAIIYRRNTPYHMRYIIGASLALISPSVGRLFGGELRMPLTVAIVTPLLPIAILIGLLILDRVRLKRVYSPYLYALAFTILFDVAVPTIPPSHLWQSFAVWTAQHL
jgi:hypothetical protein